MNISLRGILYSLITLAAIAAFVAFRILYPLAFLVVMSGAILGFVFWAGQDWAKSNEREKIIEAERNEILNKWKDEMNKDIK